MQKTIDWLKKKIYIIYYNIIEKWKKLKFFIKFKMLFYKINKVGKKQKEKIEK